MKRVTVLLDTNIILEGKALTDLPWEEIQQDGLISAIVVPSVMEEVDSKKKDGRLGPHARAFNRLISKPVIDGHPTLIREQNPRVELDMATCSKIQWDDYDELDSSDGDSRIVAEALNIRNTNYNEVLFVSHDIKPLAYARGRGLAVFLASDKWLRSPEPSPKDKEIQRLKQQVSDLRKDEPSFDINVEIKDSNPINCYILAELSATDMDIIIESIRRNNKKLNNSTQIPFAQGVTIPIDSSYDESYSLYTSKYIPSFAQSIKEDFETLLNQKEFSITVKNTGLIRADHLVLSIDTNKSLMNRRVLHLSPGGPLPPQPKAGFLNDSSYLHHLHRSVVPPPVSRHNFRTEIEASKNSKIEVHCADFRSQQIYRSNGVIIPDTLDGKVEITVSVTAQNLRGERIETFYFEKVVNPVNYNDLLDTNTLTWKKSYSTEYIVKKLTHEKKYSDIDYIFKSS